MTGTPDLLADMMAAAGRAAAERERTVPRAALERMARTRPRPAVSFAGSLVQPGVRVIAECKRRSPSRGVLRAPYDAAAIARGYAHVAAAAISVLTEPTFFGGSLEDLRTVRAEVVCPLLRKDFIATEYQLLEARAYGADAALLIVAALDDPTLKARIADAVALGIAPLVEVHDAVELDRAACAGATVIGVNSRDLRTLRVDVDVFERLAARAPAHAILVAESGLKNGLQLARLSRLGYRAFLIGERLMTQPDPGLALAQLLSEAERAVMS